VSPRRIRRDRSGPAEPVPGPEHVESWPDGDWVVRRVPGAASAKAYRCPGCDQEIPAGTPHVVAWPADRVGMGIDERRHWHTACWQNRLRRGPGVPRRPRIS
jgi:hypothetical protein